MVRVEFSRNEEWAQNGLKIVCFADFLKSFAFSFFLKSSKMENHIVICISSTTSDLSKFYTCSKYPKYQICNILVTYEERGEG